MHVSVIFWSDCIESHADLAHIKLNLAFEFTWELEVKISAGTF